MKLSSGSFLLVACIGILAFGSSTVTGQGTRCPVLGGKIDNTKWQHCAVVRDGQIQIYYDLSATDMKACVEGKTNGWVGIGFGGNGSDYVIGWNPGGAGVTVGDYKGHTTTTKDAKQDHTVYTEAGKTVTGEGGGFTHFCFQRALDTGDGDDTPLNVDQFLNFPWAMRGGDPTNANNLDNQQHGSDGTASWKLSDPSEERPQNQVDGVDGGGGLGAAPEGALIAVGAVAGVIVLAGVGYMVKQNNAKVEAYGGGMDGGWGHGGYGSSGSGGSGGHHRSRSHGSRSRSRSRSRSSKGSRGSSGSGKRSQASHRSRSKGHRH